tara:strand:- start:279 stop:458 length:180 start_codon:yes stop_codon:yes gene_type:complete
MKRKILTNNEFLNMLDGILPENDRSKLIECYPEKDQANGEVHKKARMYEKRYIKWRKER